MKAQMCAKRESSNYKHTYKHQQSERCVGANNIQTAYTQIQTFIYYNVRIIPTSVHMTRIQKLSYLDNVKS